MSIKGYLTTNNAYDAFVIIDDFNGMRWHQIDSLETFLAAMAVGDNQSLENWSGAAMDGDNPSDVGDVIAVNDGDRCVATDIKLLSQRCEFWGCNFEAASK